MSETPVTDNKIKSILERDALLIAVISGLSYYFVYSFQKAFLSHFGFSSEFADVTLGSVLSSMAGALGLILSWYYLFSLLPKSIIRPVVLNLLYWAVPIIFIAITLLIFSTTGFS